jgi:hypothetical protein
MSAEPGPEEDMPRQTPSRYVLTRLCMYGIAIGLVLASFELQASGILFLPSRFWSFSVQSPLTLPPVKVREYPTGRSGGPSSDRAVPSRFPSPASAR